MIFCIYILICGEIHFFWWTLLEEYKYKCNRPQQYRPKLGFWWIMPIKAI